MFLTHFAGQVRNGYFHENEVCNCLDSIVTVRLKFQSKYFYIIFNIWYIIPAYNVV